MTDHLYTTIRTIEAVIFDQQPPVTADGFLAAWEQVTPNQRQTAYTLYHRALRDVYHNRGSLGQTVVRVVTAL